MNLNIRPAPVRAILSALLLGVTLSSGGAPTARAETPLAEAVPCLPCHSRAGMRERPQVPSILGQDAKYLVHQIVAFQRNIWEACPNCRKYARLDRRHPVMSKQSQKIDIENVEDVARYFQSQPCVSAHEIDGDTPERLAKPLLANRCSLCHGESGRSRHVFIPSLAGQRREFLRMQLLAFRDTRWSDSTRPVERYRVHNMMTRQGQRLNDAEIDELADYFSSQDCR